MKQALKIFVVAMSIASQAYASDPKATAIKTATATLNNNISGCLNVQACLETIDNLSLASGAPTSAKYIVQTPDGTLSAEQALSALGTGLVKNTTTTGVLSIGSQGTDYYAPAGTDVAVADGGTGSSTASAARTALGLAISTDVQAYDADLTTYAGITPSANIQTLLGSADNSAARTNLGLAIGTNVQAYDADLTTWAGLTPSAYFQTLVDDADASTARTTLGLGTLATQSGTFSGTSSGTNTGDQTSVSGNAGTATALAANGANASSGNAILGVDASGAAEGAFDVMTQTEGDLKAPLASPTFTGTVTLPASTSLTTPVIGAATGTSLALSGGLGQIGGSTGVSMSAASGILTVGGIGNTNNENLLFNFEGGANSCFITSGTGVSLISTALNITGGAITGSGGFNGPAAQFNVANSTSFGVTNSMSGSTTAATEGNAGISIYGIYTNPTATSTGQAIGLEGIGTKSATTGGATKTAIGVYGNGKYSSTGTQIDAIGVYGTASKITSASGVITDGYGIYGDLPTEAGGGTITNKWGLGLAGPIGFSSALGTTPDVKLYRSAADTLTTDDKFTSARTTDLSWTPVQATDQACNTTCTSACVFGHNLTAGVPGPMLLCTDATADECLCAGAS